MKKNLLNWILPSSAVLSIALSIIVMLPGIARAATISVNCGNGITVSCQGSTCGGTDGIGCHCAGGTSASCPPLD